MRHPSCNLVGSSHDDQQAAAAITCQTVGSSCNHLQEQLPYKNYCHRKVCSKHGIHGHPKSLVPGLDEKLRASLAAAAARPAYVLTCRKTHISAASHTGDAQGPRLSACNCCSKPVWPNIKSCSWSSLSREMRAAKLHLHRFEISAQAALCQDGVEL